MCDWDHQCQWNWTPQDTALVQTWPTTRFWLSWDSNQLCSIYGADVFCDGFATISSCRLGFLTYVKLWLFVVCLLSVASVGFQPTLPHFVLFVFFASVGFQPTLPQPSMPRSLLSFVATTCLFCRTAFFASIIVRGAWRYSTCLDDIVKNLSEAWTCLFISCDVFACVT